jgi:hypothetical protein
MTIGSAFLTRLSEAKEKKEKKGYQFDRGTEAMKRAMRDVGGNLDLADKIAELANMCGVPGMYMNTSDVRDGILDAAQVLRTKTARVTSVLALHSALSNYHGVTPIAEAKTKEDDLEGQGFQQLVEEVLVSLGIPEDMVMAGAKAGVKSGIKKTVAAMRSDSSVRDAFRVYAQRSKIKLHDAIVGMMKTGPKVAEVSEAQMYPGERDTSQDHLGFIDEAKKLCIALGIPEVLIDRPAVLMAMKKVAMKNASNSRAKTTMGKATALIKANE